MVYSGQARIESTIFSRTPSNQPWTATWISRFRASSTISRKQPRLIPRCLKATRRRTKTYINSMTLRNCNRSSKWNDVINSWRIYHLSKKDKTKWKSQARLSKRFRIKKVAFPSWQTRVMIITRTATWKIFLSAKNWICQSHKWVIIKTLV